MGVECRGYEENCHFQPISSFISETIQYRVIVTMERLQELVCDQLNGAISNDLE